MKNGCTEVALGDVLRPRVEMRVLFPEDEYKEVTVSLWGKGVRLRRKVLGSEIAARQRNVARAGDFIVSKIDARHGAYGFIPDGLEGSVVTNDFPLFEIATEKLNPRWLYWVSKSRFFVELCRRASEGSTNRVRLKEAKFAALGIPLPQKAEQQRIVAHLDAIEQRLTRLQKLREGAQLEIEAHTTSLHLSLAGARTTKLGKLLFLDEEQETIEPDGSYPQVGIRSFGMGMFTKPVVTGSETTYRVFNVLRAAKFVMSQVKGWEGAVAVVDDNLDGWFVSPEYRTFSCINDECDSGYLSFLVATKWFRDQLASATRGVGARRERVRPEKLLALEMPFPAISQQRSAAKLLKRLGAIKQLSTQSLRLEAALVPSLLDRVFNG